MKIEEILCKAENNHKIVICHSMSVGCYFYSLIMINALKNPLTFNKFIRNINGQIIESPVLGSLNEMALSVSS